jgi:peptide/nickel transport system permease protein
VIIANNSNQFDDSIESIVRSEAEKMVGIYWYSAETEEDYALIEFAYQELAEEAGLNLSFIPRHLLHTFRALKLDLGNSMFSYWDRNGYQYESVSEVILLNLPNTLLLVGISYIIVFLIGIPISLSLSRNHGKFLDRFFTLLSPLSSIPAWVLGIILIMIFAVELNLFPAGGTHSISVPENKIEYYLDMAKHLALPTITLVISLLMQFIYIWRTFFMIYSEEDYVELAVALGIKKREINSQHILRPVLPFVITSFALSLISLWQMIIALEVVFQLDGIGIIFIESLPHYKGLSMFPGYLRTTVGIVVIFAYLLGFLVIFLDLIYAIIDPRIRLGGNNNNTRLSIVKKGNVLERSFNQIKSIFAKAIEFFILVGTKVIDFLIFIGSLTIFAIQRNKKRLAGTLSGKINKWVESFRYFFSRLRNSLSKFTKSVREVGSELKNYPSAIFGVVIISILLLSSFVMMLSPGFREKGENWISGFATGKAEVPKYGKPIWNNWFTDEDYPPTIIIDSTETDVTKEVISLGEGKSKVYLTFDIDYQYGHIPQEIDLHFISTYDEKRPFINIRWIRPDGSVLELDGFSVIHSEKIDFEEHYSPRTLLLKYPQLQKWYRIEDDGPEDSLLGTINQQNRSNQIMLSFTDFNSPEPSIQKGEYQLVIEALLFEEDADIDAEVVMVGQVYGLAGTDYLRRDLLIPLLWGMPYALIIGLVGAALTTFGSLFLGAISTWYGGWVDKLIERITEVNMVMPMLVIGILIYTVYFIDIWWILAFIVFMNIFGSPTKSFRAAFLQVVESPYIEAARAYGASNWRIITRYMIPRILPVVIPQLVSIIPNFIFLEATLGLFNIKMIYPTWGRVIYEALRFGATTGSSYWVLEPISLLLLTGISFIFIGNALDKILNPRLQGV